MRMGWMGLVGGGLCFLLLIGLAIVGIVIAIYNRLVSGRVETQNAYSQIEVQLKRRYDLIPNLVETVKGYATHEKETLEKVIQARNMAMNATGVADKAAAENALSGVARFDEVRVERFKEREHVDSRRLARRTSPVIMPALVKVALTVSIQAQF